MRGRYSHVATVMEGRVLLVAGGYSGVARGDLVAFKVPLFVSSDFGDRVSRRKNESQEPMVVVGLRRDLRNQERRPRIEEKCTLTNKQKRVCVCVSQDAVCEEAPDESMCLKNPECSWCEGRCREYQPLNPVCKDCFIFILKVPCMTCHQVFKTACSG